MNDLQVVVAKTAVKKMLDGGYLDICTIDKVLSLLGVVPNQEAYKMLSTLHCVYYRDMPQELQAQIPVLLKHCFNGLQLETPEIEPKKGLFGKLLN
jgi:hypothetical protein